MKSILASCCLLSICLLQLTCAKSPAAQAPLAPVTTADPLSDCTPPTVFPEDPTSTDPVPSERVAWPDPDNQHSNAYDRGYTYGYGLGISVYNEAATQVKVNDVAITLAILELAIELNNGIFYFNPATGGFNTTVSPTQTFDAVSGTETPLIGFLEVRTYLRTMDDYLCQNQALQLYSTWSGLSSEERDFWSAALLAFRNATTYQQFTAP
jgi:hypothetical protein